MKQILMDLAAIPYPSLKLQFLSVTPMAFPKKPCCFISKHQKVNTNFRISQLKAYYAIKSSSLKKGNLQRKKSHVQFFPTNNTEKVQSSAGLPKHSKQAFLLVKQNSFSPLKAISNKYLV